LNLFDQVLPIFTYLKVPRQTIGIKKHRSSKHTHYQKCPDKRKAIQEITPKPT